MNNNEHNRIEENIFFFSLLCIAILFGVIFSLCIIITFDIVGDWFVQNKEWIGFWGNFLGGILTFGGVLLTLKYQKKEAEEQNIQFEEQLKIEKEKVEYFIESQERSFLVVNTTQGNIDFMGQIQSPRIVNVAGYEIIKSLSSLLMNTIVNRVLDENDNILEEKRKKVEKLVYSYKIFYFEIENLGPSYAYEIYWKLTGHDYDVIKGGRIGYLKKDEKVYIPIVFRYTKNVDFEIVYTDCTGKYRKTSWKNGNTGNEALIKEKEFKDFILSMDNLKKMNNSDITTRYDKFYFEGQLDPVEITKKFVGISSNGAIKYDRKELYKYTDIAEFVEEINNVPETAFQITVDSVLSYKCVNTNT